MCVGLGQLKRARQSLNRPRPRDGTALLRYRPAGIEASCLSQGWVAAATLGQRVDPSACEITRGCV
jgi:hypothetical protein